MLTLDSPLILRINFNMRKVRFSLCPIYRKYICIVASEKELKFPGFTKFPDTKTLKEFYMSFYSIALKLKIGMDQSNKKTPSSIPQNSLSMNKRKKKNTDADFNARDIEEDEESPEISSGSEDCTFLYD